MNFHSLTRRELQTLCKKNKIPANITNVAMADALKALETVEGIGEFLEPSQSETAHSSIESPTRSEISSPYVPPTGGRTRITRSFRTTRKALTEVTNEAQAEVTETPAPALMLTSRKKVQMASACRKMDSQLKECVEKKDVLMTSRRRGVKEESAVKSVYSTRRSARLAEKTDEGLDEVKNEESELNKALLAKEDDENEKMNLTEALYNVDEVSEITGLNANTIMEENSENEGQVEVVSAQEQDISIDEEIKSGSTAEEEECIVFETEAKLNEEKCDEIKDPYGENIVMTHNVISEAQQTDGSENKGKPEVVSAQEQHISSEEIKIGNTAEEQACIDFEKEVKLHEEKCHTTEDSHGKNVVMTLNVSIEAEQTNGPCDICTSENEITAENNEKDTESEEKAADCVENAVEIKDNKLFCTTGFPDETQKESSNGMGISFENVPDFTETMEKFTDKLQQATQKVPGTDLDSIDKTEIIQLEHEKAAETVPYDGEAAVVNALASAKSSPIKQQGGIEGKEGVSLHSASKTSTQMTRMIVFSDNKENITMMAKNTAEKVDNLNELSVRKLTKMLKEKLEITKKSSKNDHDKEVLSRPALQALPENQLVDETKNWIAHSHSRREYTKSQYGGFPDS